YINTEMTKNSATPAAPITAPGKMCASTTPSAARALSIWIERSDRVERSGPAVILSRPSSPAGCDNQAYRGQGSGANRAFQALVRPGQRRIRAASAATRVVNGD